MKRTVLRSGQIEIDLHLRTLRQGNRLAHPPRKVLDLIVYLMENAETVVKWENIEREVWPGVSVSSASLRWLLKEVRRSLGDNGVDQRYIETTRGYGVRWVAAIEVVECADDAGHDSRSMTDVAGWSESGVICATLIRVAESQLNAGRFGEARDALRRAADIAGSILQRRHIVR